MRACSRLLVVALFAAAGAFVMADDAAKKDVPAILKHEMKSLAGKPVDLTKYKGKVLLVVNVASQCGATPQYEPLEKKKCTRSTPAGVWP